MKKKLESELISIAHRILKLTGKEDLEKILQEEGDKIALVMIGGVNYYTGQFFNLKRITVKKHIF